MLTLRFSVVEDGDECALPGVRPRPGTALSPESSGLAPELSANQKPDHDTIAEFRRVHLEALSGLFIQVLRL